jgi:hypothetical protein
MVLIMPRTADGNEISRVVVEFVFVNVMHDKILRNRPVMLFVDDAMKVLRNASAFVPRRDPVPHDVIPKASDAVR